jgi:hypothetical protein
MSGKKKASGKADKQAKASTKTEAKADKPKEVLLPLSLVHRPLLSHATSCNVN